MTNSHRAGKEGGFSFYGGTRLIGRQVGKLGAGPAPNVLNPELKSVLAIGSGSLINKGEQASVGTKAEPRV